MGEGKGTNPRWEVPATRKSQNTRLRCRPMCVVNTCVTCCVLLCGTARVPRCMYVCMYVCVYVCMCVCMCVCVPVCDCFVLRSVRVSCVGLVTCRRSPFLCRGRWVCRVRQLASASRSQPLSPGTSSSTFGASQGGARAVALITLRLEKKDRLSNGGKRGWCEVLASSDRSSPPVTGAAAQPVENLQVKFPL